MSLTKALKEASYAAEVNLNIKFIDLVDFLEKPNVDELIEKEYAECDGILVPGGFGFNGFAQKIQVANLARVGKKPYLGICYGF